MARPSPDELAAVALEVFESFPTGVLVLDHSMRKRYVNPAAAQLLDTPIEDMVGEEYRDLHPEQQWGVFEEAFTRVLHTRVAEVVDDWYPEYGKHFRARVVPCSVGIAVFFADVTAERRQEKRLLEDLQVLQQVVDHADASIVLKDLDGHYLLMNQVAADLAGVAPTQAIGRTASDFYPAPIADRLRAYEVQAQQTGIAVHREETVEYRHGDPRTYLTVTFPAYDEHGRLAGTGAIHTDVTRWKQAEAGLAASEQRFRDIFRGTSLGQVVMTPDGIVVEVNEAYCTMLGYSRSELLGASVTTLLSSTSAWKDRRRRMLETGYAGYEIEEELVRKDGSLLPALGTVNVIGDPHGDAPLVSMIVRDQSQVRALQERLVGAERMEAVGQLAAGIAHDVNNVLAAVSGYAQLLSSQLADAEQLGHVHGIFRSVDRASDLVSKLLAIASQQQLEPTDVDPCAVVADLEDMLRRLLPEGVDLTADCQRVGVVRADAAQLQQVLLNLVLNARDALPDGGHIRVEVNTVALDRRDAMNHLSAGRYARVAVSDDGVGMPPEVTSRCFEPFFTTRRASGGHGLGLSTAFGIARQSGGDLRVTSEPGRGTTFELLLPAQPETSAPADRTSGSGSATVLVAEDDPVLRELVIQLLTARGHRVLSAPDGAAALELVEDATTGPDLLVTDVDMPHLDGTGLAAALRRRWPALPVLFVSGTRPGPEQLPGHLVRKPFTNTELVETADALLTRSRA